MKNKILNHEHLIEKVLKDIWYKQEEYREEAYLEYSKERNIKKEIFFKDLFLLPKNHLSIINQGNTQLVLRLNEDYIIKMPYFSTQNYYIITKYPSIIKESYENLNELGLNVVYHEFYSFLINKNFLNVEKHLDHNDIRLVVSEDLTKNNKYTLKKYMDLKEGEIVNEKEIKEEFNKFFKNIESVIANHYIKDKKLLEIPNDEIKYLVYFVGGHHIKKEKNHFSIDIESSIKNMFFIKIDKEKVGRLFLADIDHLYLVKLK